MTKRIRIKDIKLLPGSSGTEELKAKISKLLRVEQSKFMNFKIIHKSLDARKKSDIFYVFTAELTLELQMEKWGKLLSEKQISEAAKSESENTFSVKRFGNEFFLCEKGEITPLSGYNTAKRIIVTGCGPSGLFAALTLAEAGLRPLVIERGKTVEKRMADIGLFLDRSILNPESNVLFGEGGAGTFSDGKLTTGTNDPRNKRVLDELASLSGAPEELRYVSKPHIGTDSLIEMLTCLRNKIISLGGEFSFETKLTGIHTENGRIRGVTVEKSHNEEELPADCVIIATGNSASDTVRMLQGAGVEMAQKPFSIGVRIEHPRELIDRAQHGVFASSLPAADYKLSMRTKSGRGVYTFCMCPGGFVIPSVTETGRLCVNGMSNSGRDNTNSNSALLVTVNPEDFCKTPEDFRDPLAGLRYRESIEGTAFRLAGEDFRAPVTLAGDFLEGNTSFSLGEVMPSYKPGFTLCDISLCFEDFISGSLREAIIDFDRKIKGFASPSAILTAPETRSSSPYKILRGEDFCASVKGLFPAGEGGGFAGGIMSSAVDGIKAAEALCRYLTQK